MKRKIEYKICEEDFEEYAGRKPTSTEFDNFFHLCKNGLTGQIEWGMLFMCVLKDMRCSVLEEVCECGGSAKFLRWDENIPILKCEKCRDTFEAHENSWRR